MRALSLRSWLALSHGLVLLLPVLALLATGALTRELELEARGQLLQQGEAVAALAADRVGEASATERMALSKDLTRLGQATRTRIRILDQQGSELVASRAASPPRDSAPAVELVTATVPLRRGAEPIGSVELSMAPRHPLLAMRLARWRLLGAGGAALAVALLLGLVLAHRISRPIVGLATRARQARSLGPEALAGHAGSRVVEVGALARELATTAGHLAARQEAVGEYAANVSHELKTPVTTLRSSLELLRDDPQLPSETRDLLVEGGLEELARLDATISGLLALARAEQGGRREPVELDAVVAAVVGRHPGVQVELGGGRIPADPDHVDLAIDNLVANALRHGGGSVRVRSQVCGEHAVVSVLDGGPGIPPERLDRIFERFYTTAADGTGLGLPIVRAVVEAGGGTVKAESRPGETLVEMTWPALRDHQLR